MDVWPRSIGIAGAWGYIGRKFLDAALRMGVAPAVFDPGPMPGDLPADRIQRFGNADEFYRAPIDLYHLALHPDARQHALDALLARARREPIAILNEKPMAPPERPDLCNRLIAATDSLSSPRGRGVGSARTRRGEGEGAVLPLALGEGAGCLLLFDFHELYSPLTDRIVTWLARQPDLTIHSIEMLRSKDREDPANPRNYKRMVPIQYQETVHCLAWVLFVLGRLQGSLAAALEGGISAAAQSQPYAPPNPQDYPHAVDGQCTWELLLPSPVGGGAGGEGAAHSPLTTHSSQLAPCHVTGRTDFKRGAPWTKCRVVRGTAAGCPFTIEAEFQEGRKQLIIDGVDHKVDPLSSSPEEVLKTFARWRNDVPHEDLVRGVYPNPRFAHATYQLSAALWRASRSSEPLRFASLASLLAFDAAFAPS